MHRKNFKAMHFPTLNSAKLLFFLAGNGNLYHKNLMMNHSIVNVNGKIAECFNCFSIVFFFLVASFALNIFDAIIYREEQLIFPSDNSIVI